MTDVEIVKKGYLKDGFHSQMNSKPLWYVFRIGSSISGRILDVYSSEKDSNKKNAIPRDRIYLRDIQPVVVATDNPKQFYLLNIDRSIQNCFEAQSEQESTEWVFALNAVCFGRGTHGRNLRFFIHVNKCPKFGYSGYGVLEVRDDVLIVWSQGETEEVVRWKLGHLRSFKAKVGLLEIIAGSRSSTGEGVFMFGTQESVLITHTLETVIDRLARAKRAEKMKAQQALPPLPPSNPPPSTAPTTVRGRTSTRDLVPSFTDVPPDASLRQPRHSYDHRQSTSSHVPYKTSLPAVSNYDKLNAGSFESSSRKSVSVGTLPSPRTKDIYSSDFDDFKRSSHMSLKKFDYSYVETEPKCVLLSPTQSEHGNLDLGEIRHSSSSSDMKKLLTSSSSPSAVKSDYYEAEEDNGAYSMLNPVNETDLLPQGLYNQLAFKGNETDHVDESPPPPLPPQMFPSPTIKKGYENIGTRSVVHRISEGSRNGLTDSIGSLEFNLEGSDSPKIIKKSKSPIPSPRQSPNVKRKVHEEYDQMVPTLQDSSPDYNKVKRKDHKSYRIDASADSGLYSKLATVTPTNDYNSKQIGVSVTTAAAVPNDDNQYSQLSSIRSTGSLPRTGDYDQLILSHQMSQTVNDKDSAEYSKFSRSNMQKMPPPDTTDGSIYSSLQQPSDSARTVCEKKSSLEDTTHPQPPPRVSVSYEEVSPQESQQSNPYDEVAFTGPDDTTGHDDSTTKVYYGNSIYDDEITDVSDQSTTVKEQQSVNLTTPPIPPRRGASMQKKATVTTGRKPPPLKPKPNIAKT